MAATGYLSETVTVGSVSDKILQKPSGSSILEITPTVLPAIAQTSANAAPATTYYTKTSSTVLHLNLPSVAGITTNDLIGIFWTGADGSNNFCLDCVVTSASGGLVVITAPTLSAAQLAAGMLYFNGASTTGASDVTGKVITPGTTTVTFSLATLANSASTDYPSNPDISDITIPAPTSLLQLLFTCGQSGAVEFLETATVELAWNYAAAGDFYSWIEGQTAPWAGTVNKVRFYSSSLLAQVMQVGALLA